MIYEVFTSERFFTEVTTEEQARSIIWSAKYDGKDFVCPCCKSELYYQIRTRPEVRTCKACKVQTRLRSSTIFEYSKVPLLVWVKALFYITQGKRGMSATELKRHLRMKSYGTVWIMLHKIRAAFQQKDEDYQVGDGVVELDGASFGKRETGNQSEVLVAIETKEWTNKSGKLKSKAGFAKVLVGKETKENAQKLVDEGIQTGAMVNTDGGPSLINLKDIDHDYQVVSGNPELCARWLPWVHKFISNAKTWVNGTHHGVRSKYLARYLGEYTYRFNRRHDLDKMFHRGLVASAVATPVRCCALAG